MPRIQRVFEIMPRWGMPLFILAALGFGAVIFTDTREPHVPPPGGMRFTAVVVFQAGDCESNLNFLNLFNRPQLRAQMHTQVLLGPSGLLRWKSDEERVQAALPGLRYRRATRREWRTLVDQGVDRTPYIVVRDEAGHVRLAHPAPASITDFLNLADDLNNLVTTTASMEEIRW